MIELIKREACAMGKGDIVRFPNSETAWIVLDVFNTGTNIKYIVINENLYYSVIIFDVITGEYSNPEKGLDLIAMVGDLRNTIN